MRTFASTDALEMEMDGSTSFEFERLFSDLQKASLDFPGSGGLLIIILPKTKVS